MKPLRAMTALHRLMLVWFVLYLAVGIASPMVHPIKFEMVCSGSSIKFIAQENGDSREMGGMSMDCPLCVLASAPPPPLSFAKLPSPLPLAYATRSIPAAHIAAATAAPLPARGPPTTA